MMTNLVIKIIAKIGVAVPDFNVQSFRTWDNKGAFSVFAGNIWNSVYNFLSLIIPI